jgi:hypothetical protein
MIEEPENMPPLPDEAPPPGSPWSMRVTSWPSRCSQAAEQAPMMPAPMMTVGEREGEAMIGFRCAISAVFY